MAISPAPGTPDASPDTQISVLGVPARSVRSVTVIGSASGRHTGRLRAYASAPGASYLLDRSLAPGESVRLRVVVAGRGAINERFTVAHPGVIGPPINIPVIQLPKLQRFVSNPLLLPPRLTVNRAAPHLPGDIFLTPLPAPIIHPGNVNAISIHPVGPGGPMIVGSDGRLIWFHELAPPDVAAALQVARLGHRSVLTWWQGSVSTSAFGQGAGVIADTSYRILHTVHTGNGYAADIHEFQITPDGQAFMIAAAPVRIHRPGTPAGTLWPLQDSVAQEIDIRTGLVMWEWHGYGHIPLRDSDVTPKTSPVYDAYHFNSLNPLPGGRVLVSARDTSAVYSVRQAGGAIQWTLGGRASSFRMGPGAVFHFQHDARPLPGHRIGLFDDEAGPPDYARASRGLILALDLRRHRAMVARQYHRGGASLAASEGSLQTLPGGGALVGFGATPWISQFSASGRLVFDAALPADDGSYRALRFDWHATPRTRPAVAARSATGRTDLYVSWNGATEVARWQVRSGRATLVTVADRAFETRIAVPVRTRYTVRALDRAGHVLAESPEVPAP
ncbi:MAG TPA: arylsulfotransferase family protein [Solirubrobacteraceae bacterium]|nr:arylsulfotransferase family protein [Solirubrobacteraceae bacterium]